MKKRLCKLIALFCASTILLFGIPLRTNADNETVDTADSTITIVEEDTSLRGMYEKHFIMSDGSYQATVYNEPVHQLINNTWIEVDNTLSLHTSTDGTLQYETVNGITDVSFSQSFQNRLVTMKQDQYSISWGVQAISPTSGSTGSSISASDEAEQPAQAEIIDMDLSLFCAEEQKTVAQKSVSTIQYTDALAKDVDLEYTVLPSRVKENIILNSPQSISAYVVNVYAEELSARLLESKEIEFFNTNGEVIFTMSAPYMYDSASALSEEIDVEIVQKGNQYFIAMTPDLQWLSDTSRVYPVVIDPSVRPSQASTNIIDNYVLDGSGTQNSALDRLYIGTKSGATARAYIKYSAMPYIPSSATINTASVRLILTSGTSTANDINAYQVTGGDWSSGTINWSNKPAASTVNASSVGPYTSYEDSKLSYSFNCTSMVRAWYSGSTTGNNTNYGLMVRYTDESLTSYNTVYSADCSTESNRPRLTINYTLPELETSTIVWPAPNHYTVTSKWGYRTYNSSMHYGIDISCNELTLVAAVGGTVLDTFYSSSAGYSMVIKATGRNFQVRYYHLKKDGYLVTEGSTVDVGDPIAISGNTGSSSGPHLHFQLQWTENKDYSYNPLDTYHPDDQRSAWTNPNPMFYLVDGIYVPNEYFSYLYKASDYNDTDGEAWKK